MALTLNAINRYPVKSCRGDALTSAVVEPWGLAGDRRWMLVDPAGEVVTAREANGLVLIHPTVSTAGLHLTAPGLEPLDVPIPVADPVPVAIWKSRLVATPAGATADAWFTRAMGRPARLVYLDDPTRRPTSPGFGAPQDVVSFADGYPLLLTTESSLAALNAEIARGRFADQGPLPMTRFRPNVVVTGNPAWAEDDWRRLRIGSVVFRVVKGCARCVLTTIDPDTAGRGKEPIASLARIRRWDGETWFGSNLVPDLPAGEPATITVGDRIEVLDAVPAGTGPLRRAG